MKKITLILSLAVCALVSSCTAQGQKTQLKSEIDSLSYAIGMARVQGLDDYLMQQEIDSTMMVEFLRGFKEGSDNFDLKSRAHAIGVQIGQMVSNNWVAGINSQLFGSDSTQTINRKYLIKGFMDGVTHDLSVMDMTNAQSISEMKMQQLQQRLLEERFGENKAAGEQFLAENKTKEGVQTTASGLQYKVVTMGTGKKPNLDNQVKVNYKGTLIDGTEFDSSYSRNEPATFRVGQVITGWSEALQLMPVGSKFILYIPQELGYGSREVSNEIKPFSTLIFEVELLDIVK